MPIKPVVQYTPTEGDVIVVGNGARVYPVDHPSYLVSNKHICYTSEVLSYDKDNGVFETRNTVYIPVIKE